MGELQKSLKASSSLLSVSLRLPLLLLSWLSTSTARTSMAATSIPVGVILDLNTTHGKMVNHSLAIAVEDYYLNHTDTNYKINLQVRSVPENEVAAAADKAWDLINNTKVRAIVGPQNSEQARYVVELGEKHDVPVIWFSPSGPSLSPPRSIFSFNSSTSQCVQFRAIAAIIEAYSWQCVIPIYEQPEFGNDLIPCLTYALQDMDTRVPYTSAIRQDFQDSEITKELKNIQRKGKTCVSVAHMTPELWSRLVKRAQKENMTKQGHAWILTQGLSSVIDPNDKETKPKGLIVIDGALGVKPLLADSDITKRDSLAETLMSEYDKALSLSLYGLWAYDTITALAIAVENSNETGQELGTAIMDTEFQGLSGNFSLREGQLEPSDVAVYNVRDQREITIGYWRPERGFYNLSVGDESVAKFKLPNLTWPGNTTERPPKLKIGIPSKAHFTQFVHVITTKNNVTNYTGLAVDVFRKVVAVLPFNLSYDFVAVDNTKGYDDLLCNMRDKDVDVIIGDITAIVSRTNCVDFTMPYLDSSVSMVVKARSDSKSLLILFEPFDWSLWLILGASFVAATAIVILLEKKEKNGNLDKFVANPFLVYMCDVKLLNNATSKWAVIVVPFLLGLSVQVYTANLTSILTERTTEKSHQWKDIQEIKRSQRVMVGYQNGSWVKNLLTDQIGFDEKKLKRLGNLKEYNDELSKEKDKKEVAEAIFDETPYLMLLLSKCPSCKMTGPIYKTGGFAFAFQKNSVLVSSFSSAILKVTQNARMFHEMKEDIGLPDSVNKSEYNSDVEARNLTKDDFGLLFPLALFVLILFCSVTILKLPSIYNALLPWLHNKFVSFLSPSGLVMSIKRP